MRWSTRAVITLLSSITLAAAGVGPALASHGGGGGGGGGGTTPPPTPAIQLAPDSSTLTAGQGDIVQLVVSPAAPAGGETLTITTSNAGVTAPSSVAVAAGSFNAQFAVTAGAVTASTSTTLTVGLGVDHASVVLTVSPALARRPPVSTSSRVPRPPATSSP